MRIERRTIAGALAAVAVTLAISQAEKLNGVNPAQATTGNAPDKVGSALGQPSYLNEGELRAVMPAQSNAPAESGSKGPELVTGSLSQASQPAEIGASGAITVTRGFVEGERVSGNRWSLPHPDQDKKVEVDLPEGFTPDKRLHIATDVSFEIPTDFAQFSDWEKALNTQRAGGALAGYNYDYNDFCAVPGFFCNVQGDMFGWRVFQGQRVEVPGIGILEGGPRRSVVLIFANRADTVQAWDNDSEFGPVYTKRGFSGTGRVFDADDKGKLRDLYTALTGHWLFRQFAGTPEKSYIGITDSPDNATEALVAVVQRLQWGLNITTDNSPRMEFQLVKAKLVQRNGKSAPAATATPKPPSGAK